MAIERNVREVCLVVAIAETTFRNSAGKRAVVISPSAARKFVIDRVGAVAGGPALSVMGKHRVDERRATTEAVPSWQLAPDRRASSSVPLA